MIGERTRHALAAAKARGVKLGNPEQAKINRVKAAARAQALRPHIERCIKAGRASSSAIVTDLNARGIATPNGGQWFPMQVHRIRDRLGYDRAGGFLPGARIFRPGPGVLAGCTPSTGVASSLTITATSGRIP
jgi:hypothetical protein